MLRSRYHLNVAGVIDGFLGVTLLYAALSKALAGGEFARSLTAFRVIRPAAHAMAVAIILAEGLVGVCLAAGVALWLARPAAVTLLGAFTVILFGAWLVGFDLQCACFGGEAHSVRPTTVLRDAFLALLGAYALLAPAEGRHLALALVGAALAAVLALLGAAIRTLRPMEVHR